VVSIDVKKTPDGKYEVFTRGATAATGLDPVIWAKEAQNLGAGEILITSVDQEGTLAGYDTALIRSVAEAVSIPVIAHGGAGKLSDFKEAIAAVEEARRIRSDALEIKEALERLNARKEPAK